MQCSKLNTHSSKCMILLECLHDQLRSRVLTDSLTLALASYENYCFVSLWTTLRCVYINWTAPTIDIFNLDYPPIINIFKQPSEPFSLDLSHDSPRMFSAYGMHVCHFHYSPKHMQIYKYAYIYIKIKSHNHVM